jgi:NitT/TauT family transport system permease protein
MIFAPAPPARRTIRRRVIAAVIFLVSAIVLWEAFKLVAGDPIFVNHEKVWDPPLSVWLATDVNLPHVWVIWTRTLAPLTSGSSESLGGYLIGQAVFTMRESITGFAIGAVLGIAIATVFVQFRFIERAFVPYVVASQTIPIIALAPLIMFFTGHNVSSVIIIATYLCFFPVTIAMLRGLRSPDPRALELMRSYAASRRSILWKLRFPASLPYLFTALKITATASVVGAIVGEGPGGMQEGLGRALMFFSQQYGFAPEKLWASIFVTAGLGILFYLAVVVAERWVLRGRPQAIIG